MKRIKRRYRFPDGSNYPILESTNTGTLVLVTDEDCQVATRKDPTACALAQAAIRMGYEKAFIAGTVAYLVTRVKGEDVAIKYTVPIRTQAAIKEFDETGISSAEGYQLRPLSRHATSAAKKRRNDKRTTEQVRAYTKTQKERSKERARVGDLRTFRHLSGHVRTSAESDA